MSDQQIATAFESFPCEVCHSEQTATVEADGTITVTCNHTVEHYR